MIGDGDLEQIFDSGDFDTEAVFIIDPDDEDQNLIVRGIFTAASEGVNLMGNAEVEAIKPSVVCLTDAITTVRNKMNATVNGDTYIVEKVEPTGVGTSVVWLKTTNGG